MTFDKIIYVSDIISIISLFLAVVGGDFSLCKEKLPSRGEQ